MNFGIDYAWGRPGVTAIRNLGANYVIRYVSRDITGKNLDHVEAATFTHANIPMVLVWEQGASDMLYGANQGAQDAHDGAAMAHSLGMPDDRPLFFAADWDLGDAEVAAVLSYLHGCAQVIGHDRVGIYGGYRAVKAAMDAGYKWGWQTYAWSGGAWDDRAQLQQYSNDHFLNGVGVDYNRATRLDFGQWKVGWSPAPIPVTPQPKGETEMPMGMLNQIHDGNGPINTALAFEPGQFHTLRLVADNGYFSADAVSLRVAFYIKGDDWNVQSEVKVDSRANPVTIPVPAAANGVSIVYMTGANVPVGWALN